MVCFVFLRFMWFNFLLGWFRVDSGLGQGFIAGWLKVGVRFIENSICQKFICVQVGLDLGLFWVGLNLYLAFVSGFI